MVKRITLLLAAVFAVAAGTALADDGAKVKGPFFGTVHAVGSIDYKDASHKSWTWDRGRITALSSTSITLTRRDKVQVTFAITSSTAVRNDGASYQLTDLHVGLVATVISQDGNAVVIRRIRGEGAARAAGAARARRRSREVASPATARRHREGGARRAPPSSLRRRPPPVR